MSTRREDVLISVVLPLYNEAAVLQPLADAVRAALRSCVRRYEIVFVNDGSTDESAEILDRLASGDSQIRVIHFARNFGHQAAVQAGLDRARGDAVVVMDSDLQDSPGALPLFVAKWRQDFDVVYAVRTKRKEGAFKRLLFFAFYRVLGLLTAEGFPKDAGNFGLLDRRVVDEILKLPERDRFFPGLRHWVGFRQTGVVVERGARYDERPRVSFWGLLRLARTAVFSFSHAPLAVFYVFAVAAVICGALSLAVGGAAVSWGGAAFFLGALNAFGVAVLGEYIARIYDQVRGRPMYIVARTTNFQAAPEEELRVLETVAALRDDLAPSVGSAARLELVEQEIG